MCRHQAHQPPSQPTLPIPTCSGQVVKGRPCGRGRSSLLVVYARCDMTTSNRGWRIVTSSARKHDVAMSAAMSWSSSWWGRRRCRLILPMAHSAHACAVLFYVASVFSADTLHPLKVGTMQAHLRQLKGNNLYCGWKKSCQYIQLTYLALCVASFEAPSPQPPAFNVEAWLWTPWPSVNKLPVNIEHGGQGGISKKIQTPIAFNSLAASNFLLATFLPSTVSVR